MDEFLLAAEKPPLTRSQSPLSFELQFQQLDRASKIGKLKQFVFARLDGLGKANGYILSRLEEQMEHIRNLLLPAIIVNLHIVKPAQHVSLAIDNKDTQRSFLHRLKQKRRARTRHLRRRTSPASRRPRSEDRRRRYYIKIHWLLGRDFYARQKAPEINDVHLPRFGLSAPAAESSGGTVRALYETAARNPWGLTGDSKDFSPSNSWNDSKTAVARQWSAIDMPYSILYNTNIN